MNEDERIERQIRADQDESRVIWDRESPDLETELEAQIWRVDPEAKKYFQEITKDIPLANLDPKELLWIRQCANLMFQAKKLQCFDSEDLLKHDMFFLANASLAKKGFLNQLFSTGIREHRITREEAQKKKGLIGLGFGGL